MLKIQYVLRCTIPEEVLAHSTAQGRGPMLAVIHHEGVATTRECRFLKEGTIAEEPPEDEFTNRMRLTQQSRASDGEGRCSS